MEKYRQLPLDTPPHREVSPQTPKDAASHDYSFLDEYRFECLTRNRLALPHVTPDEYAQIIGHTGDIYSDDPRTDHLRKIAPLGGKATAQKHGPDHHRAAGRKGYEATRDRYFGGSDK